MKKKRGISLMAIIVVIIIIIIGGIMLNKYVFNSNVTENQTNNKNTSNKLVNQIKLNSKFSDAMLEENGIGNSATIDELNSKFPNLNKTESYVEGSTGNDIYVYTSPETAFIFKNGKLSEATINGGDYEFNGIKIGDKQEDVIDTFYNDGNNKEVKNAEGKVIGKYLYGEYTIPELEGKNVNDIVEYGYINYIGNDQYDESIQFVYMQPPYVNTYASIYDNINYLEISIKDGKVISFSSKIGSWAE